MQAYKYGHHRLFRGIHQHNAILQVFSFSHVPLDLFLCLLPGKPILSADGCSLTLDEATFKLFTELNRKIKQVELAVKALKVARRKGKKPTTKDAEEDSEDE